MIDYILSITKYILSGLGITLKVYFVTLLLSLPIGIILASIYSNSNPIVKKMIGTYTWVLRGTPLLLQLYFVMYGLPLWGIKLSRIQVAYVTFTVNYAAYFTEIVRGGIASIDQGQYEASQTLGFNKIHTFFYIILPQSIKRVLPSVTNEAVTLVKDTALVAAIALGDILRNTKEIVSRDFKIEAFLVTAVLYLCLSYVIVKVFEKIEKRYAFYQ